MDSDHLPAVYSSLPKEVCDKLINQLHTSITEDAETPQRIRNAYRALRRFDKTLPSLSEYDHYMDDSRSSYSKLESEFRLRLRSVFSQDYLPTVLGGWREEFDLTIVTDLDIRSSISSEQETNLQTLVKHRTVCGHNVLHAAVSADAQGLIQLLVQKYGVDLNSSTPEGWTALHEAAFQGYTESAIELLNLNAKLEARVNVGATYKWTPLFLAVTRNHSDMTQLFLSRGGDVWQRDNGYLEQTVAHAAAGAISDSCLGTLEVLLSHDATLANARDSRLKTPLHRAAPLGNMGAVEALLRHKADINATDFNGATPLHITWQILINPALLERISGNSRLFDDPQMKQNVLQVRDFLVSRNANLKQADKFGQTAGRAAFIAALLEDEDRNIYEMHVNPKLFGWRDVKRPCHVWRLLEFLQC